MEIYLTIDEYMDTFFRLLEVIGAWGALIFAYCGFKLAKEYLDQHTKKLDLEEFYKVRADLYFSLEELEEKVLKVLSPQVFEFGLEVQTYEQQEFFSYADSDQPYPLEKCPKRQQVEILYSRLLKHRENIKKNLKKINELTLFIPENDARYGQLNMLYKKIHFSVENWLEIERVRGPYGNPMIFQIINFSMTTERDPIKRYSDADITSDNLQNIPSLDIILRRFPVEDSSNPSKIPLDYNGFIPLIDQFKNQLLNRRG